MAGPERLFPSLGCFPQPHPSIYLGGEAALYLALGIASGTEVRENDMAVDR